MCIIIPKKLLLLQPSCTNLSNLIPPNRLQSPTCANSEDSRWTDSWRLDDGGRVVVRYSEGTRLFACSPVHATLTVMKRSTQGRSAGGLSSTKAPPATRCYSTCTEKRQRSLTSHGEGRSSLCSLSASADTFQVSRYAIGPCRTPDALPGPFATCRETGSLVCGIRAIVRRARI